jgi:taurine dioxygenase
MATLLVAREVPEAGGDTLFANQYLAYETLSEKLRSVLHGLRGVSSSAKADASRTREDRIRSDGRGEARKLLVAEHPAVRTHPETGRKALYVNRAHTVGFAGMTEAESEPLLEFLFRHQIRPEFTCRFRWTPGALAIWDNRCAQHYAVNDYAGQRRIMQRITLAGDVPT